MFKRLTPLLFVFVLTACGGGGGDSVVAPIPQQPATPTNFKVTELEAIDTELRARHPDLFFSRAESDYVADYNELLNQAESISDTAFRLESTKLVATLGDQHTYMIMPEQLLRLFPVEIWWQDEKAIVVKTDRDHSHLLGSELVSIDGNSIAEMKDIAMQYLAYQNPYWKDALSPRFLRYSELLFHEGLIASPEQASFVFLTQENEEVMLDIASKNNIDVWIEIEDTQANVPLYKQHESNYHMMVDGNNLYIQYNAAFDSPTYPLSQFLVDLQAQIQSDMPEKIIVDIRFNHGGLIGHFLPVIDYIAETELNHSDRLFVLTGRHTFSSGVGATVSFDDRTNATFVGTPTGGKPNGFSHVIGFTLSGTLNTLYMSTQYLEIQDVEQESFLPDHITPFTQENFNDGSDPALIFINNNWPSQTDVLTNAIGF